MIKVAETEIGHNYRADVSLSWFPCPTTESMASAAAHPPVSLAINLDQREVVTKIGRDRGLNEKQWVVFKIISKHFITKYVKKKINVGISLLCS